MKPTTRLDYLERIRRVLRYAQEHLDEPLTPAHLAGLACLSRYHFHRVFSAMVGESIGEHVRRLRLERAAGQLRRTDRPVVDIALDAGYDAHEAFTRAFRDHFGQPPSVFRSQAGPLVFPPALCGVHYGPDEAVSRFVPLQENTQMIDVLIEPQPARHLLALAHVGDYQRISESFGRLAGMVGPLGLIGPDSQWIGVYHDDPEDVPTEALRSHACVTVPAHVTTAPPGLELLDLPAGPAAIGVHVGPYRTLDTSYAWLFGQWMPSSGYELGDAPCYEVYVNDPGATPEAELITHICVPLAM